MKVGGGVGTHPSSTTEFFAPHHEFLFPLFLKVRGRNKCSAAACYNYRHHLILLLLEVVIVIIDVAPEEEEVNMEKKE